MFAAVAAIGLLCVFIGMGAAALTGNSGVAGLLVLIAVSLAATLWMMPTYYPEGIETLGDLADRVSRLNVMMLKAHGAGLRHGDIWLSMRDLAGEQCGISAETIFPDTPLYQRKVKSEAA